MEIGVDVGGTFTDLVSFEPESGRLRIVKVPTTAEDQSVGFLHAINAARQNSASARIRSVNHGSTVAINALIERKGCKVGLVTTRGFRDILELRRRDRPSPFGLQVRFEPLVPRERRFEVSLRIDAHGDVIEQETEEEITEVISHAKADGTEFLVISLFNGFLLPQEEKRLADRFAEAGWPCSRIVLATEISQEIREFDRTGTAAANAYVKPAVERYLARVDASLKSAQIDVPLLVAQSNGGISHWSAAAERPIISLMSGPSAGVVAAARMAEAEGFTEAIACDIGGTSTDVTVIAGARPLMRRAYDIEFGLPILQPMIDVRSIGAGGGSIARLDRGGLLQVGPESAGSHPGPAAYEKGGTEATVTDAQIVLGMLPLDAPLGTDGTISLSQAKAAEAIDSRIGKPLGLSLPAAALAILSVAQQNIAAAIKQLVTEKGRDPKEFALIAYGGGGASHVCALMRELGVRNAIVPLHAGATSALGCLMLDQRADLVRSVNLSLKDENVGRVRAIWREQETLAKFEHAAAGAEGAESVIERSLWCCYEGQAHSIQVPVPDPEIPASRIQEDFERHYHDRFGLTLSSFTVMITAVQTVSTVPRERAFVLERFVPDPIADKQPAPISSRIMTTAFGRAPAPVYRHEHLPVGFTLCGPSIVEQSDTTIIVEQGFRAEQRHSGALLITQLPDE